MALKKMFKKGDIVVRVHSDFGHPIGDNLTVDSCTETTVTVKAKVEATNDVVSVTIPLYNENGSPNVIPAKGVKRD